MKQTAPVEAAPPVDQAVAPPGERQLDVSTAQLLDSIYFAQNGSTLTGAAVELEAMASLATRSDSRGLLLIIGYADPTESSPHELSLRRAIVVREFLVQHGVPRPRIKIEALGAAQPGTEAAAQPNRNQRVEIRCVECADH